MQSADHTFSSSTSKSLISNSANQSIFTRVSKMLSYWSKCKVSVSIWNCKENDNRMIGEKIRWIHPTHRDAVASCNHHDFLQIRLSCFPSPSTPTQRALLINMFLSRSSCNREECHKQDSSSHRQTDRDYEVHQHERQQDYLVYCVLFSSHAGIAAEFINKHWSRIDQQLTNSP